MHEETDALNNAAVAADEAADAASEARNEAIDAANAIEHANDRAEQAEQTAKAIAEAAVENERGQRIAQLETELRECQDRLVTQDQLLRTLETKAAEMDGALAALVLAAPASPIPEAPPMEAPVQEVTEPNEDAALVAETVPVEMPVPTRRKRRWI